MKALKKERTKKAPGSPDAFSFYLFHKDHSVRFQTYMTKDGCMLLCAQPLPAG